MSKIKVFNCSKNKLDFNKSIFYHLEKKDITLESNINKAQILYTLDYFPEEYINLNLSKINHCLKKIPDFKNESINQVIIFSSKYEEKQNPGLTRTKVIYNYADPTIFYPNKNRKSKLRSLVAISKFWSKSDKKLKDIKLFAQMNPNIIIFILGYISEIIMEKNIIPLGFIHSYENLAEVYRQCDAMIHLSHSHDYSESITQGIACGLPIFYLENKSISEYITSGIEIPQSNQEKKELLINNEYLKEQFNKFLKDFENLKEIALSQQNLFDTMVEKYTSLFNEEYYGNK